MTDHEVRRVVTLALAYRNRWPMMGVANMMWRTADDLKVGRAYVGMALEHAMATDAMLRFKLMPKVQNGGLTNAVRVM